MKPEINGLAQFVRKISFFSNLDDKSISAIVTNLQVREFFSGEVVIWEGETAKGLYLVKKGWLKVTKTSSTGREMILNILGQYDSFNLISIFTGSNNPANVLALENSEVLFLEKEIILKILNDSPEFLSSLLFQFANKIQTLTQMVGSLSLKTVESRLAFLLLKESPTNIFHREKWLTQDELAALIGTVPDVLSRVLRGFVEAGLIEFDSKKIKILDRSSLQEKADTN